MTKKHFIALADSMREAENQVRRIAISDDALHAILTIYRNEIGDFCKSQNGAFMHGRWVDYIQGKCGPNGGQVK